MDKVDVVRDVHAMVAFRLFGSGQWRAHIETVDCILQKLHQLGLDEKVPGASETWQPTALGNELNLHLIMVFLGLWEEWEMLLILEKNGLIDEVEQERIFDLIETCAEPERLVRPFVRRAYLQYYSPSGQLN
jgi:hypothetical protein